MDILENLNQIFSLFSLAVCFYITVISASHPFHEKLLERRARVFMVPLTLYFMNALHFFGELDTELVFWMIEAMLLVLILFTLTEKARILDKTVIAFLVMPAAAVSIMTLLNRFGAALMQRIPQEQYFWALLIPLIFIFVMITRKKRQPTLFFAGSLLIVLSYGVQFFNGSLYVPELSLILRMGTYLLWTLHFSLLTRTEQTTTAQALAEMQDQAELKSRNSGKEKQKGSDQQMLKSARKDPLTGVYNRISIMDIIDDRIKRRREKGFSILLFDIDKLKQMNEIYGRETGDSILIYTAVQASSVLRNEDRLGRYGEDEFVLMMPNADLTTARQIAERIRIVIQDTSEPAFTISAGIAAYPKDGITVLQLIKQAEYGLHTSKAAGGNKAAHTPHF